MFFYFHWKCYDMFIIFIDFFLKKICVYLCLLLLLFIVVIYSFVQNHVHHMTTCCKKKGTVLQSMFTKCCKKMNKAAKHVCQMLQNIEGQCCKACSPNVAKNEHSCKACLPHVAKHWEQCWKTCLPNVAKTFKFRAMLQSMFTECCKTFRQSNEQCCKALPSPGYFAFVLDFSIIYLCWFQIVYNHETTQNIYLMT